MDNYVVSNLPLELMHERADERRGTTFPYLNTR